MKKFMTIMLIVLVVAAVACGLVACNIGDGDATNNIGGIGGGGIGGGGIGGGGIGIGSDSVTDGGHDGIFNDIVSVEEVYGYSAASAGMLISSMGSGEAVAQADSATLQAELNRYMELVESLVADGGFQVVTENSDREGYAKKMTVTCTDSLGANRSYVIYFNERLIPDDDDDDDDDPFEVEEEYRIDGVMTIDGADYAIYGERSYESEPGEEENEIEFRVTLSETRWMYIEQSSESEVGENEKEYSYAIYERPAAGYGRGALIEKFCFEFETEQDETELKLVEYRADGSVNTSFAFKSDVDRQGNEFIRLRVGNGGAAEFYSVTVTLDEAGNKVYNYNPIR